MSVLFISDLHLCEERPETVRAFLAFLEVPARGTEAVYILGDLFEYWAGDDDPSDVGAVVMDALCSLTANGTRTYFVPGNRDFLIGPGFAERTGITILPDPFEIRLAEQRILLSHGDALCTDDTAYQRYREQVREPAWQANFLAQPIDQRMAFIEALRQRSQHEKSLKSAQIMDVNAEAVAELLRRHDYPTLIHGHTHRPAHHLHQVDGRHCERWVLSDWHGDAPYLLWKHGKLEGRRFRPPPDPSR